MTNAKWNIDDITEESLNEEIDKAKLAAEEESKTEIQARFITYYNQLGTNTLYLQLENGTVLLFPPKLIPYFTDLTTEEELADCFVWNNGRDLRWESLDLDLHLSTLLSYLLSK